MCDLLAYHDLLSTPPAPEMEETGTTTTSDDNSTEDLLALVRLNVEDTCAWVSSWQLSSTGCEICATTHEKWCAPSERTIVQGIPTSFPFLVFQVAALGGGGP